MASYLGLRGGYKGAFREEEWNRRGEADGVVERAEPCARGLLLDDGPCLHIIDVHSLHAGGRKDGERGLNESDHLD